MLCCVVGWLLVPASPVVAAGDDLPAELRVEPLQAEPVFTGQPGAWDARIRERGWIQRDGDRWRLWYTGYAPEAQPPLMRLGLATSSDGLTWSRYSDQPLIRDLWVEDMMVVPHDGRLLMFAEGRDDQAQLLESEDGVNWTRIGTLDVRQTNGQPLPPGPFGTPTALLRDGVWHLFYERRDAGIWLATSTDLKVWRNVSDDPVIRADAGDSTRLMIAMNQIVADGDRFVAVLHGSSSPERPRLWATFLLESADLRSWTMMPGQPLRPVAENKSSGQFVADGTGWRLYTMHDKVVAHRVLPATR
jgi:hypothetical protein